MQHGVRRREIMPHVHSHDHSHGHVHGPDGGHQHSHAEHGTSTRALTWALVLTVIILIAEGVGGWLSNSLALLADAGHVFTDAGALGLSLFVAWLARQPGSQAKTFGYLRWEILAALINGATLLGISGWIVVEAILRFKHPEAVQGGIMLGVAVLGFVINAVAVWLLHGVREGSLNIRGAYLHVLGDLLASGGTVVAALLVRYSGWLGADPVASLITTALIISASWQLVRESVDVLLEAAPPHSALGPVRERLESIPGVESVHDLHVWSVTSGMVALSVHAIVRDAEHHQLVLERAHGLLKD